LTKTLSSIVLIISTLLISFSASGRSNAALLPFSLAFYYASDHPLDELKAFDVAVVDPDSGILPSSYGVGKSELFAYVSLGEADPNRAYSKQMDPAWFIGTNKAWKTKVIDTSSPGWRAYFIDQVIAPLWAAGYRGFFVDTLDSYQLAASKDDFARMEEGIAGTLREVRHRFPGARLILNRGFEVFGQLKGEVFAVAAESLFQRYDPVDKLYGEVPEKDREWLLARFKEVRDAGVPVIAIDYVPPEKRALARQTAERIKDLGIIPWVADKDLASLGVGAIEVMPRKILGVYDGGESSDSYDTMLNRLAAMPLNYLGYQLELCDLRKSLPEGIMAGRYAGVVVWPDRSGERQGLKKWTLRRIREGVPIVFLDRFGFDAEDGFFRQIGLELNTIARLTPPARIVSIDPRIGFEQQPLPQMENFLPMKLKEGTSLLRLASASGDISDAAAITPWGGYVLYPFGVTRLFNDQNVWVVNPFRFFKDALRLPDMPVPDTTTENGVRLLLSHVDGDGFESMAEWPGGGLAADELRRRILEKYRIPVTVSVITGVVAPNGLYPGKAPRLEQAARDIFSLPWVEAASHSFSHPFRWKPEQVDNGMVAESWHTMKIPGYNFNLEAEISGSLEYINNNLLPAGKKVKLFQWTGNCLPGEEAIRLTYQAGLLNINGGDTMITDSNRSLTRVAPLGISRNGWFQVFAPNQNENVYTNLWSDTFYGYRRVLETYRLTEFPRRLKPVNIYYHIYSASKTASLKSLLHVHDWALEQRFFSIYTSEYIEKVLDFNRTVVARDGSGWLVRNSGKLKEFRIPQTAGFPELTAAGRVAGFSDHGDSRYIHLLPGGEARIQLKATLPTTPYLSQAGGTLESLERSGPGMKIRLRGYTPFSVAIANADRCVIREEKLGISLAGTEMSVLELPEGTHALDVVCH